MIKTFLWDAFISHACEDKDEVVRELVRLLNTSGLRIWYDELTLDVGDSLRRSLDRGIADSRFGIVILSHAFFAKEWPQRELDGLAAREVEGRKIILPVWHQIGADDVRRYSPMLADRIAIPTAQGIPAVRDALVRAIGRSESDALTPFILGPSPGPESPRTGSSDEAEAHWRRVLRSQCEGAIKTVLNEYTARGTVISSLTCKFDEYAQFYIDQYVRFRETPLNADLGVWGIRAEPRDSNRRLLLTAWTFRPGTHGSLVRRFEREMDMPIEAELRRMVAMILDVMVGSCDAWS